ncbi:hypothetical protein CCP4SC76_7920021 [Gammaproteobacteria bacterium]
MKEMGSESTHHSTTDAATSFVGSQDYIDLLMERVQLYRNAIEDVRGILGRKDIAACCDAMKQLQGIHEVILQLDVTNDSE